MPTSASIYIICVCLDKHPGTVYFNFTHSNNIGQYEVKGVDNTPYILFPPNNSISYKVFKNKITDLFIYTNILVIFTMSYRKTFKRKNCKFQQHTNVLITEIVQGPHLYHILSPGSRNKEQEGKKWK